MQGIEPAVRCPTLFLGDRPMDFRTRLRAHAVRTQPGTYRLRRGPESDPRRIRAHT
jgi:hypothetical protein